mgnify:FL=1
MSAKPQRPFETEPPLSPRRALFGWLLAGFFVWLAVVWGMWLLTR